MRAFFALKHEKGGSTSYFLTSAFREIDTRKIFHNSRGKVPFFFSIGIGVGLRLDLLIARVDLATIMLLVLESQQRYSLVNSRFY